MEDVLDLYAEPYDPRRPWVCFDETPYQMVGDVLEPMEVQPGRPKRVDYEYEREGSCNLFVTVQPQEGWRDVVVTERRTAVDFAHRMKALVDELLPEAEVIRVVTDNLNTHTPASLYQAFPAEEARRIARKLEFHYTPKHGSWLNMAEIEIAVLARQCLKRRIPNRNILRQEVAAWQVERNEQRATINWRFTTTDARTKLERLYRIS
jgi:DDE superfamily endonuclease